MAKAQVDICDVFLSQIHEHLLRAHFRMEPLCIALERHLSTKHPLYEILKYHCRGLLAGNSGILTNLITDGGHVNLIFGLGSRGSHQVIRRGYKKAVWDDINLEDNLKKLKCWQETVISPKIEEPRLRR
eukprot:Seg1374.10 transcript_id=Seg1374.10/GoldUCD/mRNA.D3Y31 product="Seed linoleate 9S-lipoxygenase-3" protein_id=Seg1374.10/GoldUCD/D3Y31